MAEDSKYTVDAATLEALRAAKPENAEAIIVDAIPSKGLQVVLRPAKPIEATRWRKQVADEGQRPTAMLALFRATVLYPEAEALEELLKRYPLLPEGVSKVMLALAGCAEDAAGKD